MQKQSATKNDVAIVGTWNGNGGPMLWVDHIATRYHLTMNNGIANYLDSGRNPIAGQWQHLAATYDGTTARFYIDGTEVASRPVSGGIGSSNNWRIGAYGSTAGGFFDGLIDNIRIYNRGLTPGEITTNMNQPVGLGNPGAPTQPGSFVVTTSSQTSLSTQWSPSTDDVGVTGYRLFLNGSPVGTTTTTSFTYGGLSCGTTYTLGVEAFDGSDNTSPRTLQTRSTSLCDAPSGLVASYSFDEGSGLTVGDSSGNGHAGTITGATWATGRYGGGLDFNGTNASVDLGGLGTFYQTGFTLEAWVQKQSATKNDVAIVGTWNGNGGPMLWVDHIATRYHLTMNNGIANYLDSGRNPIAGQWQHLAATYDGTTARFYIDGTEVASRPVSGGIGSSNNWRIGAYGSTAGGFFDGLIDNIRIYNRGLTPGEITTNMIQPVTTGGPPSSDGTPPTAPGTLTASGSNGQAALSWGAATDNIGVTRYNVHRSTTAGFTPSTSNRIAQPTSTSHTDTGLAAGTYYYKVTAEDAAGNVGPASNESSATVTAPPDTAPPSAPGTLTANGLERPGGTQLGRRDRQHRRDPLQRPPLDHRRLHPEHEQPDRAADLDEPHRHGARRRHLLLQGHRRGRRRQHRRLVERSECSGDRRHDGADRVGDVAGRRRDARRARDRHRERQRQPGRRGRPVPGRHPEPRCRRHREPVLDRLGHARRAQRPAHTEGDRSRRRRQHADFLRGDGDGKQPRRLERGSAGRIRLGRRLRYRGARLVGQCPDGHACRRELDGRRQVRRRGLAAGAERQCRSAAARHLLQDRFHLRGLGAQAVGEGRRRRRRLVVERGRSDDLGRPRDRPLPADPRHQLR